jgi:probable phosphoglycerate mutase
VIYLVRHGETDANRANIVRGRNFDDELNATGLAQAKSIATQLAGINFDVCYCSPLKRARQTCDEIFRGLVIYDDRLLPRDYGDFVGKQITDLDHLCLWNRDKNLPIQNGESVSDIEVRVRSLLDDVRNKHKGQTVLMVWHGSVMSMAKAILDNFNQGGEVKKYSTKNCEIITVKI